MPGKLLAIVRRQAAALQPIEQTDQANLNSSRSPVLYLCCQQQASLSVNHGNQAPSSRLAQNGVHLPVSDVKPLPGVPGSKLDGNAVPAPQMFPCVKGQAPGKPGLEQGLQLFVLQLEGQLTALAAQTIELVCLVGTL